MEPDIAAINARIINEYRQALADAQFGLTRANAQLADKDRIIAAQAKLLEEATAPETEA